ncbi:hypothetical protein Rs2_33275 [Raphanus sativus]|nr:hypothetical protein Rs2_33275 [Raphanus sativus]
MSSVKHTHGVSESLSSLLRSSSARSTTKFASRNHRLPSPSPARCASPFGDLLGRVSEYSHHHPPLHHHLLQLRMRLRRRRHTITVVKARSGRSAKSSVPLSM